MRRRCLGGDVEMEGGEIRRVEVEDRRDVDDEKKKQEEEILVRGSNRRRMRIGVHGVYEVSKMLVTIKERKMRKP